MVQRSKTKQTTVGGVILAVLVALYGYARPVLNERFQWDLPPLPGANESHAENHPVSPTDQPSLTKSSTPSTPTKPTTPKKPTPEAKPSTSSKEEPKPGPLAGRVPKPAAPSDKMATAPVPASTAPKNSSPAKPAPEKPASEKPASEEPAAKPASQPKDAQPADTSSLRFGLLKDLGGDRYVSPSGLLYTRGSAEGHRLDHLERHTVDDPGRPGKHGVFDGGMEGALKMIDRAYERAKTGQKTTKEMDEGRVIYTVDMGGRVGFIGGQDGNRLKKPMARRVRIVLDQQRVITAYPL